MLNNICAIFTSCYEIFIESVKIIHGMLRHSQASKYHLRQLCSFTLLLNVLKSKHSQCSPYLLPHNPSSISKNFSFFHIVTVFLTRALRNSNSGKTGNTISPLYILWMECGEPYFQLLTIPLRIRLLVNFLGTMASSTAFE